MSRSPGRRGSPEVALFLSPDQDCNYLPDRRSRNLFIDPDLPLDGRIYQALLEQGFRRSGRHVYRPGCEHCRLCLPVRIPVDRFRPRRSQRRVAAAHVDLKVRPLEPAFRQEHYELYQAYTLARHGDGEMAGASDQEFLKFLVAPWCDSLFLEMRQDGELLGVAVTDVLPDALSAVYTFFDPREQGRSPGVAAVLSQIELARQIGLHWLYLGYWIPGCRKMDYKDQYRPIEVLTQGNWCRFDRGERIQVVEMDATA
jgi:arginine-tRNA-protein transferase